MECWRRAISSEQTHVNAVKSTHPTGRFPVNLILPHKRRVQTTKLSQLP